MTDLVLIAAVAENGVIGVGGEMPWHLPADLRHFKETTTGHPVIMGRHTYESIVAGLGEPLPGRTSIVLTTGDLDAPEGVVLARGVEEALDAARDADDEVAYVVGGGTVYEQFLPLVDRMLLTEVHDSFDGDTHFPEFDDEWVEVEREERDGFAFVTYERG
jgi:dihydrofolate reductase